MTPENKIIKTPEEAIETIKSNMPTSRYQMLRESLDMAVEALEKVQHYREMDKKLREVFGDCDGLLETTVDSLCRHEGEDIGRPIKSRLLTDETVDVWDAYLAIGTVEECRDAVEKQKPKKCVEDSCPDHTHYKCPSCGKIQKIKYDDSTFGCILNNCSNCGQALMNENLEE